MDIREVRRRNLKALMDREFGVNARGAQTRLAEKLEKPQNFISRCLADPDRAGSKTIGEDFAREIEEKFGLARYALDLPIGEIGPESNVQPAPQQPAQLRAAALAAIASPRSQEVLARIAKAAEDGRLTEDDLLLLERIAARFEQAPTHAPAPERGSNTRLRERLRKNDPNAQQ